jgi:hypothetical protein
MTLISEIYVTGGRILIRLKKMKNKNSLCGNLLFQSENAKLLKYIRGKTTSSSLWIIYKISNKLEEFNRIEQFKSIRKKEKLITERSESYFHI